MRTLLALAIAAASFTPAQAQSVPALPALDVLRYEIEAEIVPLESFISGQARVRFIVSQDSVSLPFELNSRLALLQITDEQGIRYASAFDDFDSSLFRVRGPEPFAEGVERTLTFRFEGNLEKQEYAFLDTPQTENTFIGRDGALLLSEQRWFPVHRPLSDAAQTWLQVTVPLGFTVVAAGELGGIETSGVNEVFTWESRQPLARVPVVVSRFFRQSFEDQVVPMTFFVTEDFQGDLGLFAEAVGDVAGFYLNQYGSFPAGRLNFAQIGNIKLPSAGSAGLILMEAPVWDIEPVPLWELARRVAQQYWGNSVRFSTPADAWLADGFATYAALRFLEARHPERFKIELARQAIQALKYESEAPIINGLALKENPAKYDSIVSSKGAWVLYMFGQLEGRERLDAMVRDWYAQRAGQSASIPEWVAFVSRATGTDYSWFFVQWIESVGVPEFRVDYTIYKLRDGNFKIKGQIRQDLELFRMPVDLLIHTKGKSEEKRLTINGKETSFTLQTETLPQRIEFDPHGKVLSHSRDMQVAVFIALGDEYARDKDFVSAIREYDKATEMDPRSSLAHYRLGEVFFEQQNLSAAANSFRDALNGDLEPEWVETWIHIYLGKIYDVLGQRQRALAEYRKALNSGIDYRGAQAEAQKYTEQAYVRPSTLIEPDP